MDRRALGPLTAGCSSLLAAAEDILELLDGRVVGGRGARVRIKFPGCQERRRLRGVDRGEALIQNSKMPKYLGA